MKIMCLSSIRSAPKPFIIAFTREPHRKLRIISDDSIRVRKTGRFNATAPDSNKGLRFRHRIKCTYPDL
jgi:hypothetical protein